MKPRGHAVAAGGVAPPTPSAPLLALGLVVGAAAISTSPILVRVAHVPALALAFWRCLGGALALAPFALRRRGVRPTWREAGWLAASGCFLALHFALWNASLSLTTVASSTVLVSCSPLFVGLAAGPLLGEPPPRQGWLGIGLTIAGAALIALGDAGAVDIGPRGLLGDAMAFGGSAAISAYLLIGRSARRRLPATTYAASVYGVAAAVLLPACLLGGAPLAGYATGSWLAIGGVLAGPQLLGHTVFNTLLATLTADVVAVVVLAEPVGATILAWLLLGELPTPWFWPGAALVLAGVWLAARGALRLGR
ncbi:MAG TPA: DMT family transporter [Actinomycetes bacterium]|nr:DMT family transporter [Actinomycetes bacterium]